MSTKSKWNNGVLTFYDGTTQETIAPLAPVVLADDFLGADIVIPATAESGCKWAKKIVGAAPPTVAGVANETNGALKLALTNASQKQDAALYTADQLTFNVLQGLIFEARLKVTTLPTGTAESVWGVTGAWADGPDAITYSIFFTADGSGEIICESDDDVTNASATSGVTVTASDWKTYRIDCTDVGSIKFYIDGTRVATGTTFTWAASSANSKVQPYLSLYKASGTDVGDITVDYVRVWQNRS